MKMQIWVNGRDQVARLAQLTQKTNQFNLTTKRYSEQQVNAFLDSPEWLVAYFALSDIFGESGTVGLALVSGMTEPSVEIDTFLLSCRVLGRQCEDAFLHQLLTMLHARGKARVVARYVATSKNALVRDFWERQGFTKCGDETFALDLKGVPDDHPSLDNVAVQLMEESS